MAKVPEPDAMRMAAEWLDAYESDGDPNGETQKQQCEDVAAWLRAKADALDEQRGVATVIKELAEKHKVPVKRMREIVKQRLAEKEAKERAETLAKERAGDDEIDTKIVDYIRTSYGPRYAAGKIPRLVPKQGEPS